MEKPKNFGNKKPLFKKAFKLTKKNIFSIKVWRLEFRNGFGDASLWLRRILWLFEIWRQIERQHHFESA